MLNPPTPPLPRHATPRRLRPWLAAGLLWAAVRLADRLVEPDAGQSLLIRWVRTASENHERLFLGIGLILLALRSAPDLPSRQVFGLGRGGPPPYDGRPP